MIVSTFWTKMDEEDLNDSPDRLAQLIKEQDLSVLSTWEGKISSFDQPGYISKACETNNPGVLLAVLDKFEKTCNYYCFIKGSYTGPTELNPWDAVGRATNDFAHPQHSASMAAVIIAHPLFVGRCELVGCSPNEWQSMIGLFHACYGTDPVVWAAVKNNPNLPKEAGEAAAKLLNSV